MKNKRNHRLHDLPRWYNSLITVYLRLAVAVGFLSAVADRFGWWGPPGAPNVSWGNFQNFLTYTAKLNPWFSGDWIPIIGWTATVCEICFGVMLLIGYRTRLAAVLSGFLTLAFAFGMVSGGGIHPPLSYSVFAVSAGSFLLAGMERYPVSLDAYIEMMRSSTADGTAPGREAAA